MGRVGIVDPDVYFEYENNISRAIATQPFQANMQAFSLPKIELTVESGVGNDDAENPMIGLELSRDAKTYGPIKLREIGRVGEFTRRAVWYANGMVTRFVVMRFTLTDPVKPVIAQLTVDLVSG